VRVFASNGANVMSSLGQWRNVFSTSLTGRSFPVSRTESFAPEIMGIVESRSFGTLVLPSDTVRVDARYLVQGLAIDDCGFVADAATGGLGLNVPMAVIRVDP